MFVKTSRLDWLLSQRDEEIKILQDKYWALWHRHNLLLTYLGLAEIDVPAETKIIAKLKE